jgi:sugar phosphate isomerase/epimerase
MKSNHHAQISEPVTRRDFLAAALRLGGAAAATAAFPSPAADPTAGEWKIGCYTRPWDKFDWRAAFDSIAEAGYKYVGLMTTNIKEWVMVRENMPLEDCARYAADARQRGLKVLSAYGTFSVAESLAKGVGELQRVVERCAAAESPNLLLGGTGDQKQYANYYRAIAECAEFAAARKVGLSIKPHGGSNATGPQCRQAIETVGHKNFGLWYDPGNIFYYSDAKLDPVDDAATVNGLVVGMSVKDFLPPKDVMVTPGAGRVRFPEVFEKLRQGGFTGGPLVVECVKRGDRAQITAEAKKARLFLEELVARKA